MVSKVPFHSRWTVSTISFSPASTTRKSPCYQAPQTLLPCPPHRIPPLWKQNNRSSIKQMSRINHLTRIIKQTPPPCSWTKSTPSPWFQRLVTSPKVPHTYPKTGVAPVGQLNHQATAKSSTLHRGHPRAPAKPFPRPNTRARKTDVSLKADKQQLVLVPSSKHQPESPLHPDHQTANSPSPSCHVSKINQSCNQPPEKLPSYDQKSPSPPPPDCQSPEVPSWEDHRSEDPTSEAEDIPSPDPEPPEQDPPEAESLENQDETSQKSTPSVTNLKHVIIIPSCDNQSYSWATAFESPSEAQHSKTSHTNLCPRETASPLRCGEHPMSKALGVTPSHPDQKTRVALTPSPEEQAEHLPVPTTQASFPMEVECWEMTSPKTDHQAAVLRGQDQEALHLQDKALPEGRDHLETSQVNKVTSPRASHQAAARRGPDHGKASVLSLDTEKKTLSASSHETITQISLNYQARDIVSLISQSKASVSTQTETCWKTTSVEKDHQSTILDQNGKTKPVRSATLQNTSLPGFHQAPSPSRGAHHLESVPRPNTQPSFPSSHIKLSGGSVHHFTPSPNTLAHHKNQNKAVSGSRNFRPNHTPPIRLNNHKIPQARPSYRTRSLPIPNHQNEILMALDSNHQGPARNGSQHQGHTVPKKQGPRGFNYIKPYIIEGGSVPAKIVHAIINSIPQEQIKNDISKQIHLWRIGNSPSHWPGQFFSSNYLVCLICVSWIPYGCPHVQKTKYPCVIQLLAIPMLLPGSKQKLNVKFIFQVPQTIACNIFSLPYTHYCFQRPLNRSPVFPTSSHSDPVLSEAVKKKWLHFILGKNHHLRGETTIRSRQSCIKEMPRKRRRSNREGPKGLRQRGN
ncbi:casein kinase II subunit alpha'-interacting protein-like isoform X2 [Antechinus flavipes]|uniref:casein kinase II subunit alpha'-interacting protein-like isoform X2 n=1 Tax=Antechinus flavipes TaxID=38775 RepID=UPI00223600C6|nr:casein kinase II subunit alpha'-interacting protein-like isoform X2 [Antechinus flavipes]